MIYLVTEGFDETRILGAFTTREKAQGYIDAYEAIDDQMFMDLAIEEYEPDTERWYDRLHLETKVWPDGSTTERSWHTAESAPKDGVSEDVMGPSRGRPFARVLLDGDDHDRVRGMRDQCLPEARAKMDEALSLHGREQFDAWWAEHNEHLAASAQMHAAVAGLTRKMAEDMASRIYDSNSSLFFRLASPDARRQG